MVNEIFKILRSKNLYISFAESCTGGLCAARLVNVAGASNVINESYVTYSNEAKNRILGVSFETIDKYDVVSEEVTYEMANGLHKISKADVCVSVSGIAGPDGDVGKVCFGFYINGVIKTYTKHLGNVSRSEVINRAVDFVYITLIDLLK